MATASLIVNKALIALGISNELSPPDEYLQEQFFNLLTEMLELWSSVNIQLGITLPTVPSDELGNPDETTMAIYTALAIDGQDTAKVVASAALRVRQKKAYIAMKASFGIWAEQSMPGSLPLGQGVNFGPRSKRYFPEPDSVGSNSDTALGG